MSSPPGVSPASRERSPHAQSCNSYSGGQRRRRLRHPIAIRKSAVPLKPSAIDPYQTSLIRVSAATAPSAIRDLKERDAVGEAMMPLQQPVGFKPPLVAFAFLGMRHLRKVGLFTGVTLAFAVEKERRPFAERYPGRCGLGLESVAGRRIVIQDEKEAELRPQIWASLQTCCAHPSACCWALKRFIFAMSLSASWMKAISCFGIPPAMSRERTSS
jgi:hypothetical protein